MGGDGDSKPSAGHKTEKSLNYDAVQTTGKTEKSLAVQMAEKPVNYATKSDSTNAKEARGADQEDQPSDEHGIVHDGGILEHDLFLYRLSHRRKPQLRLCPGETLHRERSGLTTTCGCLFGFVYKKKPTYLGEIYQRSEP